MVLSRSSVFLFYFLFFFPSLCWPTYSTSVISRSVTWLFRGSFSSILRSVKIRSIERLHDKIIVKRFSFEGPAWSKTQTATFCTGVLHGRYHRPRMANHWHRQSSSLAPVICVQVYSWSQFFALNFVKHTWLLNNENCHQSPSFTDRCTSYQSYKPLKFTLKRKLKLLLHVSVYDRHQGTYTWA